jgi:hypothetical protein
MNLKLLIFTLTIDYSFSDVGELRRASKSRIYALQLCTPVNKPPRRKQRGIGVVKSVKS